MPGVAVVNQPGVYFVDEDGNVLSADDGTTIANHEGIIIAGKDGTTMRFMRVAADGTLRIDPTGTTVQPISATALPLPTGAATQATLASILADTAQIEIILNSLDGKDYATQSTLAAILTDTGQIETLLTSLDGKDFATETTLALKANAAQFPGALVGGRLDTNLGAWLGSTAPTVGQKAMLASIPVTIASNQSALSVTSGASVGQGAIAALLLNGGSSDMVVNGSGTPVSFSYDADPTDDIAITSLRLVITVGGSFDFDGDTFGDGGSALGTGVEVNVVANNGAFNETVTVFTVNEDFARLLDFQPFADIDTILTASLPFGAGVVLEAGTSDKIEVVINDNVALGVRGIDYFTATAYGYISS